MTADRKGPSVMLTAREIGVLSDLAWGRDPLTRIYVWRESPGGYSLDNPTLSAAFAAEGQVRGEVSSPMRLGKADEAKTA